MLIFLFIFFTYVQSSTSPCIVINNQSYPLSTSSCPLGELCGFIQANSVLLLDSFTPCFTMIETLQQLPANQSKNDIWNRTSEVCRRILVNIQSNSSLWRTLYQPTCTHLQSNSAPMRTPRNLNANNENPKKFNDDTQDEGDDTDDEEPDDGDLVGDGDDDATPGDGEDGFINGNEYVDSNGNAISSRNTYTGQPNALT